MKVRNSHALHEAAIGRSLYSFKSAVNATPPDEFALTIQARSSQLTLLALHLKVTADNLEDESMVYDTLNPQWPTAGQYIHIRKLTILAGTLPWSISYANKNYCGTDPQANSGLLPQQGYILSPCLPGGSV